MGALAGCIRSAMGLLSVVVLPVALVAGCANGSNGCTGVMGHGSNGSGSRIAFERDAEIYVMNADGSGETNLTRNARVDYTPAWSPDGSKIAFVRDHEGYVMNADGSGLRRLTDTNEFWGEPAWSPDGCKIAFTGLTDRDSNGYTSTDIYVMNARGGGQQNLMRDGHDPAWSPDGSKIAFESEGDWFQIFEISVMNADGSGQRRLTRNPLANTQVLVAGATDEDPAWSPDGSKIAFVRGHGKNAEIYVMNADGSGLRRLTRNRVEDYGPAWQPALRG